jgi:hypothetical protein
MTIETTLGALVQAESALQPICALKLSAKSAYHLKKLAQLVAIETQHFHAERDALITELGTARESGGFEIHPETSAFQTFLTKVNELAAVPVEISWGPITLDMLGDAQVSAQELAALGPLCAELEGTDPT